MLPDFLPLREAGQGESAGLTAEILTMLVARSTTIHCTCYSGLHVHTDYYLNVVCHSKNLADLFKGQLCWLHLDFNPPSNEADSSDGHANQIMWLCSL